MSPTEDQLTACANPACAGMVYKRAQQLGVDLCVSCRATDEVATNTTVESRPHKGVSRTPIMDSVRDQLQGRKLDGNKPRFDLLLQGLPRALEEVTQVLTYGAVKYDDHNWRRVSDAETRYLAASMRHEIALARGETHDPESMLHHLAHKVCSDLFRLELALRRQAAQGEG